MTVSVMEYGTIVPGRSLLTQVDTGSLKGVADSVHLNRLIMPVHRQEYVMLTRNAAYKLSSSLKACNL